MFNIFFFFYLVTFSGGVFGEGDPSNAPQTDLRCCPSYTGTKESLWELQYLPSPQMGSRVPRFLIGHDCPLQPIRAFCVRSVASGWLLEKSFAFSYFNRVNLKAPGWEKVRNMNRIFGRGKPKAPPPNLSDCISTVSNGGTGFYWHNGAASKLAWPLQEGVNNKPRSRVYWALNECSNPKYSIKSDKFGDLIDQLAGVFV